MAAQITHQRKSNTLNGDTDPWTRNINVEGYRSLSDWSLEKILHSKMNQNIDDWAKLKDQNLFNDFFELQQSGDLQTKPNEKGDSITHLAAFHGNLPLLGFLKSKQVLEISALNDMHQTPAVFAILSGSIDTVRFFFEEDAQFDLVDVNGDTPLHMSAVVDNLEISEFMSTLGLSLDSVNKLGESALHVACKLGNLGSCIALVAAGANPNLANQNGETALHLATRGNSIDAVRVLLTRGANPNVSDRFQNLPIHLACISGNYESVQVLCENGSKVNIQNQDGLMPLHIAARGGAEEICRRLLYFGADSSLPNVAGITADIMAFANGHKSTGKLLTKMTPTRVASYLQHLLPLETNFRIKLKLFGDSRSGKTALSESLRSGVVSGYLKRKIKALSEFADWVVDGDSSGHFGVSFRWKSSVFRADHEAYTRGIDVKNSNEFSIWEFSGYRPYYFLYDFFVGNTSCIHVVLYSLTDSLSVQRDKVKFWLEFIHSRIAAQEGKFSENKTKVIIVATHADEINCIRDGEGFLYHIGAARLLQDMRRQFRFKLNIQPELHVLNANSPNSLELKIFRQRLQAVREDIIQDLPKTTLLTNVILNHLEEWSKLQQSPISYWHDFVRLVQEEANPLCTETHLRDALQFLQYSGDIIVIESNDGNDLIVLNLSWLLSDVIGCLFSQDTLRHARITGSFTVDDLQFLIAETDVNLLVKLLSTIECCTLCLVEADHVSDKERRKSIQTFYEDAISNSATIMNNQEMEMQLEIPRLNLVQPFESDWGNYLKGSDIRHTGVQFRGPKDQLIHVFPRIQCRLRRAVQDMNASNEAFVLENAKMADVNSSWFPLNKSMEVNMVELQQWLNGSKISICKGLANIYVTYEILEHAIEIKVETHRNKTFIAFTCFRDTISLVRNALDAICPNLQLSNCLLVFSVPEDGKEFQYNRNLCKEIISQTALFQMLENENISSEASTTTTVADGDLLGNGQHPRANCNHSKFLLETLFMRDMRIANSCLYGPQVPGCWVRYEVLLDACTIIGKNDGLNLTSLQVLADFLGCQQEISGKLTENDEYPRLLHYLLQILIKWRSLPSSTVGQFLCAFDVINQQTISAQIMEQLPIFVLKDESSFSQQLTVESLR